MELIIEDKSGKLHRLGEGSVQSCECWGKGWQFDASLLPNGNRVGRIRITIEDDRITVDLE